MRDIRNKISSCQIRNIKNSLLARIRLNVRVGRCNLLDGYKKRIFYCRRIDNFEIDFEIEKEPVDYMQSEPLTFTEMP